MNLESGPIYEMRKTIIFHSIFPSNLLLGLIESWIMVSWSMELLTSDSRKRGRATNRSVINTAKSDDLSNLDSSENLSKGYNVTSN